MRPVTASRWQAEDGPTPSGKRLSRLMRLVLRWSMVTLASLAVFAVTFWGWVVLGLPPAGADQLIVAPAVAAVLSGATLTALSGWAARNTPDRPRGYLSRMSSRGAEEVYPIGSGEWHIGEICDLRYNRALASLKPRARSTPT